MFKLTSSKSCIMFAAAAFLCSFAVQGKEISFLPEPKTARKIVIGNAPVTEMVKDGAVKFELVVPADASQPAKFAANEIATQLSKAFGKKITAMNDLLAVNGEVQPFAMDVDHGGKSVWGSGHAALVGDFYDCIQNERPFAINGREGAKVVRAILAMYRSRGEEVALSK